MYTMFLLVAFFFISYYSYGFSRARYVYSLISGVGIFFLGAGITAYHGVMALLSPPVLQSLPVVSTVCVYIYTYM